VPNAYLRLRSERHPWSVEVELLSGDPPEVDDFVLVEGELSLQTDPMRGVLKLILRGHLERNRGGHAPIMRR
jgi:hypothetical protein